MQIKATVLTGLMVMGAGIFLSGIFNPVIAGPPDCNNEISKRCKNTGGGEDSGVLVAKFCLAITADTFGFAGDGSPSDGGLYCGKNKKDKVMVFTGNGPGFRFDTNKGKSTAARYVQINFPDGGITVKDADDLSHTYYSGLYEIDFRFDLDSGGLDLGGIANPGTETVPVGIRIQALDGNELGLLGYGDAPSLFSDPSLNTKCMLNNTSNALVTRTNADAWIIESDPLNSSACLWVGHAGFAGQPGTPIEMSFDFTIVIDP
jgi:hypothetical protein